MTTDQYLTRTSAHPGPTGVEGPGRGRSTIVTAALAIGAATLGTLLVWQPWPGRDELSYEALAPVRDAAWLGITLDAAALGVVAIALSLVVCLLVRDRGARWASVGAVVTVLGGLFFAMGAFAFAALAWYATETTVVPAETGAELLAFTETDPGRVLGPQMAGFLMYTVGSTMLSIALLRAASVSRWVPIAILGLTAAQFLPVPGRVLDLIQVALMAVLVAFAGLAFRRLTSGHGQ